MDGSQSESLTRRLAELEAENARLRARLAGLTAPPATPLRRAGDYASFHAIADSIDQLIWTTRADGFHDWFNRRWYEYTGMPEGSTDGEEWNGMFHAEDQERAWSVWRHCLATGEPYHIEYRLRHRSGEYRWVLGRAQAVRDERGEIVRWYGTCTDIHDFKLADEALRRSEARLAAYMDHSPDALFIKNADGRYEVVNRAFLDHVGRGRDEVIGRTDFDIFPAEVAEQFKAEDLELLAAGAPRRFEESFDFGGRRRTFLTQKFPLPGRQIGCISTDISERKDAEEKVRESEARLNRALEVGRIGDYEWDLATGEIRWSHNLMRVVGLDPDTKADAEGVFELIHPDDRATAEAAVQRAIQSGAEIEISYRVVGADGVTRWIASRGRVDRDEEGRPLRLVGVNYDVTSLYQTERRLRESEERLRIVQAAGGIGSFDYDLQQDDAICSFEYYSMLGLPQGAPINRETWSRAIHPDDREKAIDTLNRAIAERKAFDYEYRIVRADTGETRWLAGRAAIIFDASDRPWRYVGGNIDITDRKDAEERLRVTLAAGSLGDWTWNSVEDVVMLSDPAADLFGVERGAATSWAELQALMVPEDAARAAAAVEAAIAGQTDYQTEYRVVRPDGRRIWINAVGRPRYGEDAEAVGMIGAVQDITRRKEAEEALTEQSRTLETLNRTGAAVAAELDLERLVQMVTDAGVELTGARFGAFFYNVTNAAGESLMLYTLSGAHPSQFDFGMPRATAIFHPTFAGEGLIRSDDITKDKRYGLSGPHFGMPKGHLPVTSYLAVPVIGRSGEVIGGLFFGHPEPGRFSERHEQLMVGIAAQAAIGIDNARLFQAAQKEVAERMRAEAELRLLNETLEQRVAEEIERRSEAEEALRQAQKMETLGQLTGGVAHDFNNLLQIVSGNLDLLQRGLPEDAGRLRRAADNAMKGAERAAVLTQRLLAFSRRQPLSPKPIDVNRLVSGMSELLHRSLGETIAVETVLAPGLWPVEADPHQLENGILNLAVNARDAMPEGGKLTVETSNTHLDRGYAAQNAGVTPGQYVAICVSDTGTGMHPEMLERVFEPFFTTKDVGKGTGLGLSMVYGFVKQSGGHVKIYSEPGEGTTVKLYLPRLAGTLVPDEEEADTIVPEGTQEETILVCEDDDDVRAYSVEVLRELGYRVLEAHDGPSALRLLERQEGRVDLLFTDVVLPSGMSGADVAVEARRLRPDLKVLFTTGYARNAIVHQGRLDPGVELITKPFSYADLAARIRDLLDARP